jgi:hypothetical protein
MNPIRAILRLACPLAGVAATLAAAVPAAPASASPGQARALAWADPPLPPGWDNHPSLPAHALVTGGMPGWQITLIAAATALAAAAVLLAWARAARRRAAASPA